MRPKGCERTPGSGRKKGTPDKATGEAREAIGLFVDSNAHRLQDWLDKIAEGIPDEKTPGEYLKGKEPNPDRAFTLFQSVIEYHVPKLARTEVTGANNGPLTYTDLSDKELDAKIAILDAANAAATANTGK